MRFSQRLFVCLFMLTMLVMIPIQTYAQSDQPTDESSESNPEPQFWSNTTGVFFDAGIHNGHHAYISFISVAYTDGTNEFQSHFVPWTYNGTLVDGGRRTWTLNRGIRIVFDLDGYGRRECTVSTNSRYAFWSYATVTYLGNNQCSIK